MTVGAADLEMLQTLQRETFTYFVDYTNPRTGLVADRTSPGSPASIAAVGLALTSYPIAVERGWWTRAEAVTRSLATLRFLAGSEQSAAPLATGHHGFYYHFLDPESGARFGGCELSTIDTALLVAGIHTVALYFTGAEPDEGALRELGDELYRRVDWNWAADSNGTLRHGWRPESGFLEPRWDRGYSEALLLYILALGSPTFSTHPAGYLAWIRTFERLSLYGFDQVYAGPLFIHQLPQLWLDLHGVRDARCRELGFDYFENSRRATLAQRAYAIENPAGFTGYGENEWGFTASNGPGPEQHTVHGVVREFYGYLARGAPFGPDDGTLSPWAIVASLPFAPHEVCAAIRHAIEHLGLKNAHGPGFEASFNATYPVSSGHARGWVSPCKYGLNEGPIVVMIENYLSELIWTLWRGSPYVRRGLERGGFRGGWIDR
ncbi:MAG: glucoamylase family protein [Deltaproteobacteria bacterium]